MLGPYSTQKDGGIKYNGNKIFNSINNIQTEQYPVSIVEKRVSDLKENALWGKIARINHRIAKTAMDYFDGLGAVFTPLPLTTRMISSPGAVYGKEAISYTSDTCPITLNWFDLEKTAFLSESSQIYLELALLQEGVDQAFSIYNSFRKEKADPTHLSEFHHVEYEGKVSQEKNIRIALGLLEQIVKKLIQHNEQDLAGFLTDKRLSELNRQAEKMQSMQTVSFKEALNALYRDTHDSQYLEFTMQKFGSWEEIRLTELFDGPLIVTHYPLLEVPFYHAEVPESNPRTAENADIIWSGYREIVGSGHRVRNKKELEEKAKVFSLPEDDYSPYLQSRTFPSYVQTSGFGLGWERLVQGLLEMPFIWSAVPFPRGHTTLKP